MSRNDEIAQATPVTIAVVMAAYNERAALPGAVSRLLARPALAQLVIVDASDDEQSVLICEQLSASSNTAESDHRLTVVTAAAAGRASQMNAGSRLVTADVIVFLHVDTVLPAQALELVQQQVSNGARWGRFDVTIADRLWAFRMIETMMNLRSRLSGICTGDQSLFVTKALFDEAGGFTAMALMEDIDLSKRLRQIQRPAIIKARVKTSARRWRQHGIVRTIVLMWALRLGFWLGVSPQRLAGWYRQSNDSTST